MDDMMDALLDETYDRLAEAQFPARRVILTELVDALADERLVVDVDEAESEFCCFGGRITVPSLVDQLEDGAHDWRPFGDDDWDGTLISRDAFIGMAKNVIDDFASPNPVA